MSARPTSFALVASACLLAAPCLAQPGTEPGSGTSTVAERLFVEAVELMEQGSYEAAARKLERSSELEPQPGTLLNLAICYEELGRSASAWRTYRQAATIAARKGDRRERRARQAAERLEPTLSRLGIRVSDESRVAGLVVRRDGQRIESALFGEPIPIDPGVTLITAEAPGYEPWERRVTASNTGQPIWIDLPPLRVAETPPPAAPVPSVAPTSTCGKALTPSRSPERKADDRRLPKTSWVAGTMGLAELVVAGGLIAAAVASDRAGDRYCTLADCEPRGDTLKNRAVALGNASAWVAAAGAVTLGFAVGVAWGHRKRRCPTIAAVQLLPGSGFGVDAPWP